MQKVISLHLVTNTCAVEEFPGVKPTHRKTLVAGVFIAAEAGKEVPRLTDKTSESIE